MIDLHFHLLPGIDDGPQSTTDMLELAQAAYAGGTRTIVATPHLDGHWGVEIDDVAVGVRRTRDALGTAGIGIEVLEGAEVSLPRYMDMTDDERSHATLGDGGYLLLESPHELAAGNFDGAVAHIMSAGRPVLLAHPERCPLFQRRLDLVERLVGAGALCSITAASLRGKFGKTVYDFTLDLLGRGLVHNIASDAHGVGRRGPDLVSGLEQAERDVPGLTGHMAYFTEEAPRAILDGAVPANPPVLSRKSRGLFGRRR